MLIQRIELGETNCYLLQTDGGAVIVDPGPSRSGVRLITQATEAGIQPDSGPDGPAGRRSGAIGGGQLLPFYETSTL